MSHHEELTGGVQRHPKKGEPNYGYKSKIESKASHFKKNEGRKEVGMPPVEESRSGCGYGGE